MISIAVIDEAGETAFSGHCEPTPWWSFTKTVLAIAALRLADGGSLSLDQPIAGERYSLRQLLRHEAGLPDYGSLPRYHEDVAAGRPPWPIERLLAETQARRLRTEPGVGWAYSNIGYLLVARSIEQASGAPLAQALDRLVFAPAGLTTARLATTPDDLTDARMGGAAGYHPGWVYHGLAIGSTADAARLLRMLVAGALLRPAALAAMRDARALPEHRSVVHPDPAYGLGLMLSATEPETRPLGHSGAGPGSRIAVYARGGKTAAVWIATPSDRDPEREAFRLLE